MQNGSEILLRLYFEIFGLSYIDLGRIAKGIYSLSQVI